MISKLWSAFWRPSTKWGLGVLLVGGAIAGAVGWNGFHYALEKTTTMEFCVSCHTMQTNLAEYKKTIHYQNTSGVRAGCPDCHVPKSGWPLYKAKLLAAKDLWGEIAGTIDTPEKYAANRLRMAETVWANMKATDSRECRSCHSFDAMDFAHQKPNASKEMQKAMAGGDTCISCHKGIAHKLPDMSAGYKKLLADLEAEATKLKPKAGDTLYPLVTVNFYLDKPAGDGGTASGRILAATPLSVLASDGKWLQVTVAGWQQEGAERVIYEAQGKRIFNAALTPGAVSAVTAGQSVMDPDTGQNWTAVKLTAWVENAHMATDLESIWKYSGQVYGASCGMCHKLSDTKHFLANQWIGALNAMKDRASLDDEQFRLVQKYVQMHAKDMGGDAAGGSHE